MKISLITVCYNSAATIRGAMESVALQEVEKIGGERIGVAAVRDAGRETADGNRTWTIEFSNKKELTGVPTTGEAATVEVTRLKPPSTHTILKWIYGVNERPAVAKGLEIEYIVVDGGSTDGTVEEIKNFELRIKNEVEKVGGGGQRNFSFKWLSERDRGMYDALNKGIAMATGDVVGILNADDRLEDERMLADVAGAFRNGPRSSFSRSGEDTASPLDAASSLDSASPLDAASQQDADYPLDAVYGDVRFVRGESRETARYCSSKPWKAWMHYWGYMPAHPTMYVRREVFELFDSHRIWILAGRGWRKVGGSSKKC